MAFKFILLTILLNSFMSFGSANKNSLIFCWVAFKASASDGIRDDILSNNKKHEQYNSSNAFGFSNK